MNPASGATDAPHCLATSAARAAPATSGLTTSLPLTDAGTQPRTARASMRTWSCTLGYNSCHTREWPTRPTSPHVLSPRHAHPVTPLAEAARANSGGRPRATPFGTRSSDSSAPVRMSCTHATCARTSRSEWRCTAKPRQSSSTTATATSLASARPSRSPLVPPCDDEPPRDDVCRRVSSGTGCSAHMRLTCTAAPCSRATCTVPSAQSATSSPVIPCTST